MTTNVKKIKTNRYGNSTYLKGRKLRTPKQNIAELGCMRIWGLKKK